MKTRKKVPGTQKQVRTKAKVGESTKTKVECGCRKNRKKVEERTKTKVERNACTL